MLATAAAGSLWDQAAKEASAAGRLVMTAEARSRDEVAVAALVVAEQPGEEEQQEEELAAGLGAVGSESQGQKLPS